MDIDVDESSLKNSPKRPNQLLLWVSLGGVGVGRFLWDHGPRPLASRREQGPSQSPDSKAVAPAFWGRARAAAGASGAAHTHTLWVVLAAVAKPEHKT